jgi:hypothetical protein
VDLGGRGGRTRCGWRCAAGYGGVVVVFRVAADAVRVAGAYAPPPVIDEWQGESRDGVGREETGGWREVEG